MKHKLNGFDTKTALLKIPTNRNNQTSCRPIELWANATENFWCQQKPTLLTSKSEWIYDDDLDKVGFFC